MVPVGTQSAAFLFVRVAARRSRSLTVSSSPQTSSPHSAVNMAWRIAGVGSVKVSERSSTVGGGGGGGGETGSMIRGGWVARVGEKGEFLMPF